MSASTTQGQDRNRLEAMWLPRIGTDATRVLSKSNRATLRVAIGLPLFSLAASIMLHSGSAIGFAIGVACIMVDIAIIVGWRRSRIEFAEALSRKFGKPIGWRQIPKMRTTQFDAWCREQGFPTPAA